MCVEGMAPDFAREATRMTSGQTSAGLMSNSLRRRSKEDGMVTRSKSRMMRKWPSTNVVVQFIKREAYRIFAQRQPFQSQICLDWRLW